MMCSQVCGGPLGCGEDLRVLHRGSEGAQACSVELELQFTQASPQVADDSFWQMLCDQGWENLSDLAYDNLRKAWSSGAEFATFTHNRRFWLFLSVCDLQTTLH